MLANKHSALEWKSCPRTKHNWHCTIGFFINTASLYFIQYYHLFFCNELIFFSDVYISVNTVFECCYSFFGWEIGHPLSTYATGGMEGVIQNVCRCVQGGRGITPHVHVRTYTHLLFSLSYDVLTQALSYGVLSYLQKFKLSGFDSNLHFWISTRAFKLSTRVFKLSTRNW